MQELADDIKALVEILGVRRFTLVGHDWGGAICWPFASLYPDMLDNLIILNSPHSVALRLQQIEYLRDNFLNRSAKLELARNSFTLATFPFSK